MTKVVKRETVLSRFQPTQHPVNGTGFHVALRAVPWFKVVRVR